MPPDLSIIIVSWNVRDYLAAVLQQLPAATHPLRAEVIVIDNASADGSAGMVRSDFPEVTLIENRENVGFARASNQGIAAAQGRCLLLLNPDTLLPSGAIARLVDLLETAADIGAVGPRLLLPDGAPQPRTFGHDPRPRWLIRMGIERLLARPHAVALANDLARPVDWVSGACLLLRRQAIAQVGSLDETIFLYFEDNDLCLRLRRAGWQVWYQPQVTITHIGGQSTRHNPAAGAAYRQSLRYFYRKHYGPAANLFLRLALSLYARLTRGT